MLLKCFVIIVRSFCTTNVQSKCHGAVCCVLIIVMICPIPGTTPTTTTTGSCQGADTLQPIQLIFSNICQLGFPQNPWRSNIHHLSFVTGETSKSDWNQRISTKPVHHGHYLFKGKSHDNVDVISWLPQYIILCCPSWNTIINTFYIWNVLWRNFIMINLGI